MSRFRVEVIENVAVFLVEADDEDEAVSLAEDGLALDYEVTADWRVLNVDRL